MYVGSLGSWHFPRARKGALSIPESHSGSLSNAFQSNATKTKTSSYAFPTLVGGIFIIL